MKLMSRLNHAEAWEAPSLAIELFQYKKNRLISVGMGLILSRTSLFLMKALFIFSLCPVFFAWADETRSLFPINNYNQNVDDWIKPQSSSYNTPLLTPEQQKMRMKELYQHEYSTDADALSPWSEHYIQMLTNSAPPSDLKSIEETAILRYSNRNKLPAQITYGENFRPYDESWIAHIAENMNLAQFQVPLSYQPNQRAIATQTLMARALPTLDPNFNDPNLPGEGYPFDNLQMSSIAPGSALYILGESKNHAFLLVATSNFIAWVQNQGIAQVNDSFIQTWQEAAQKNMLVITQNEVPIINHQNGAFLFLASTGTIFPLKNLEGTHFTLMIPIEDARHQAHIALAQLSLKKAHLMPLSATPRHIALLLKSLQHHPYGWGNTHFYDDCSSELARFYRPFGFWLPRHSSAQVNVGQMTDLSALSMDQRLAYLKQNGHPFFTIVYIGGHVLMFIGNTPNPDHPNISQVMSYQMIWGLSPPDKSRRSIIGESVFLPLLTQYPEDPNLASLADKPFFQVSHLDEMPSSKQLLNSSPTIRLEDWILPPLAPPF